MKYIWVFLIGIPLLVVATYISIKNKKRVLEKFGVFGESAIPYDEYIKGMFTEKELSDFRKDWEKKGFFDKTAVINIWKDKSIKEQNQILVSAKQQKEERQKIEAI